MAMSLLKPPRVHAHTEQHPEPPPWDRAGVAPRAGAALPRSRGATAADFPSRCLRERGIKRSR